jgi:hypothetical protein
MSSDSGRAGALGPLGGDQVRVLMVMLLALAIVALLRRGRRGEANHRQETGSGQATHRDARDGFSPPKLMLGFAITLLENDMARRGVITGLKMVRNRM